MLSVIGGCAVAAFAGACGSSTRVITTTKTVAPQPQLPTSGSAVVAGAKGTAVVTPAAHTSVPTGATGPAAATPAGGAGAAAAPSAAATATPGATTPTVAAHHKTDAAKRAADAANLAAARRTSRALVGALNLGTPVLTTNTDASTVTVAIPQANACSAGQGAQGTISKGLRQALPFVHKVSVTVSGGQALSAYQASACPAHFATTKRPVLWSHSGSGTFTQAFKVTGKSWTLDYATHGTFLQVLVLKSGVVQPNGISAGKKATGSMTYPGPGTFELRVAGDAIWSLRVVGGR